VVDYDTKGKHSNDGSNKALITGKKEETREANSFLRGNEIDFVEKTSEWDDIAIFHDLQS
jgi:hypothetical protein